MLPMVRKAFADHRMRKGPGLSWRLAKPGTGNYSFRITWVPGRIILTGDVGDEIYTGGPGPLWESIEWVNGAGYDYLTGKATARQVYCHEATVEHVLQLADEYLTEHDDDRYWRILHKEFDWRGTLCLPTARHRKVLAMRFREDDERTSDKIYRMFGDFELSCHEYEPRTRWHYEAVQLWARTMLAQESRWHYAWRQLVAAWKRLKEYRRYPVVFRPRLYVYARDGTLNGARHWLRHEYDFKGERRACFKSVHPWKLFGHDLSRMGFWRIGGSSWPDDDRGRDYFVPFTKPMGA